MNWCGANTRLNEITFKIGHKYFIGKNAIKLLIPASISGEQMEFSAAPRRGQWCTIFGNDKALHHVW
jgi:hypothetical protein